MLERRGVHGGGRRGARRAARAATVGFAALAGFQAALAAGAPLGEAAWGGSQEALSPGQRVGSAAAVAFFVTAILVVEGRAAGRIERRYRWGTWVVVAVLSGSALVNAVSPSLWEKSLLAPVAVLLACLCSVVAHTSSADRCSDRRLTSVGGE